MIIKGITPTFIFTLPEEVDLERATHVYATFSDRTGKTILRKVDPEVSANECAVYLSQAETLKMPETVIFELNWTYHVNGQIQRAASDRVAIRFETNLEGGELE